MTTPTGSEYTPSLAELLEVIQKTHDLFLDPVVWIKGCYAEDLNGKVVKSDSPQARRFCLVGGLHNSSYKIHPQHDLRAIRVRQKVEEKLRKTAYFGEYLSAGSLEGWSDDDERTHTEVLELLFSTMVNIKDEMEHKDAH